MLKITKASDPIEVTQITACIYAIPGIGKSTLGFTAEAPLLLDFDQGSYRAGNRKEVVEIKGWNDVAQMTAADLRPYKTLIVDTAGRALDALTATIIEENPKLGRAGALTLQGYGELKSRFIAWTKLIRSFGLDVVLISHCDEQRKGDEVIERLDVQGGSKNEIYKAADLMGRLYLAGGRRVLNFSPTDTAFGKNPTQLPTLEVPHYSEAPLFLGDLIGRVKTDLNKQSETQKRIATMLADWSARINESGELDHFNALIADTQVSDALVRENVKRLLAAAAKKQGFIYSQSVGKFTPKAAA